MDLQQRFIDYLADAEKAIAVGHLEEARIWTDMAGAIAQAMSTPHMRGAVLAREPGRDRRPR